MTRSCRPFDHISFAAVRELVSAMFFSEMVKQEQSVLPATDFLPLSSTIKIIRVHEVETTVILEHFNNNS
jgi:hypothetical protein